MAAAGMDSTIPPIPSGSPLVDVHGLGSAVFGDAAPSVRTLREMTRSGTLPHFRIGKLVRYDVRHVRSALESRCFVPAKKSGGRSHA